MQINGQKVGTVKCVGQFYIGCTTRDGMCEITLKLGDIITFSEFDKDFTWFTTQRTVDSHNFIDLNLCPIGRKIHPDEVD
jgi:hypothetical protein